MIGAQRADFIAVPVFKDSEGNGLAVHHRYAPYADGTTP
jgi:hypothetical protein